MAVAFVAIFVGLVATLLAHFLLQRRKFISKILRIPSSTTVPIIEDIFLVLRHRFNIIKALDLLNKPHGDCYRFYPGLTTVFVSKPEDMEILCTNLANQDRGPLTKGLSELWLGDGLLICDWIKWKYARKNFLKTFPTTSPELTFENFSIANVKLLKILKPHEGNWISSLKFIKYATTKAIIGSALSSDLDDFPNYKDTLSYDFERLLFLSLTRCFSKNDFIFRNFCGGNEIYAIRKKALHDISDLLSKKRSELSEMVKNGKEVPNQFIFNLLRQKPSSSDEELFNDVMTLVGAALDTSASSSAFTFLMLAMHPNIQQLVYEEDWKIQGEINGDDIDEKSLAKYDYLTRVVKETMRMYPPVPIIPRLINEDTKFGKYIVPKGVNVLGSIMSLHRDPKIYEEPTVFKPERFLPENVEKRPKFSYMPFGAGIRSCPGYRYGLQAVVYLVASVIRKYKVYTKYSSINELDENLEHVTSLYDKGGFLIQLEPR